MPDCQNDGECVDPGQCECPSTYGGDTCSDREKLAISGWNITQCMCYKNNYVNVFHCLYSVQGKNHWK